MAAWILSFLALGSLRLTGTSGGGVTSLRPGQRGWGLTVLQGSQPQRFEVEVLGLLEPFDPGVQPVLVALAGSGLEHTGVIAGMSGSPVYVDGELIGAVAFAWPFAKAALAGVTPIGSMREIANASTPKRSSALRPVGSWRELWVSSVSAETRWQQRLASVPGLAKGGEIRTWQLVGSGFGPSAAEALARAWGTPVAAALGFPVSSSPRPRSSGIEETGGEAALEAGSAVAQIWIDGDLQLAATGTVTERSGDQLLAFGHAVLGLGQVELPLAPAEVVAVLPSSLFSFKLARIGRPVGRFEFDHLAGAVGRLGVQAATTPVALTIQSRGRERGFALRLARVPELMPFLGAIGIYGALDVAASVGGIQSLDLELELELGDRGAIALHEVFDGEGAGLSSALFVADLLEYLVRNELGSVDVTAIRARLATHAEPRRARLDRVSATASRVRPGETVKLRVELLPVRGAAEEVELEVAVPSNLPDGRWILLVGDGWSIEGARQVIEPGVPRTLDEVVELVRHLPSQRELVVLGLSGEPAGIASDGVLPRMPPSLRWLRSGSGSSAVRIQRASVVQEQNFKLERPVEGFLRLDLVVDRKVARPGVPRQEQRESLGGAS